MNMFYTKSKKPFALTTLCLLLSACGGGSNTIIEDPTSVDETAAVQCLSTDKSCIDFVFDDTPVVNLNYECGKYRGVTNATGVARCPIDSNVSFYLKANGGVRRVNLGVYSVKAVRDVDASELQDTALIRVGVKELAENTTKSQMLGLDNSPATITAINLSRLLQSLGRTSEPYVETAPVNRIYIDNDVKADIEKLTKNVEAEDFKDAGFEEKLAPWLSEQKRTLISVATARARLEKNILAIKSGIFFATPTATLDLGKELGNNSLDLGISGFNGTNRASVALYTLADRIGQSIGYGLEWTGSTTTAQDAYTLFLTSNFAKMRLTTSDAKSIVNPYTNRLTDTGFKVGAKEYTAAEPNQYKDDVFRFVNGRLIRDLGILGSATIYEFYTGVKVENQNDIGTWEQKSAIGANSFTGNATLFKTGAVNTYLDPIVWRTKDSVKSGTYFFPLYATLTFNYNDAYTEACKKQGLSCATSDSLPIVFLENGDILTDTNAVAMNSAPLCGANSTEQTRIGTVRAAYPSTDGNQLYINPSIILSGPQFAKLDGIQIGTSALAPRVKINLAGIKQAAAGQNGSINITDAKANNTASGELPASWVNGYNTFTGLRVAQRRAEIASEGKIEKPSPDVTKQQELDSEQLEGLLTIKNSSCYQVKQK